MIKKAYSFLKNDIKNGNSFCFCKIIHRAKTKITDRKLLQSSEGFIFIDSLVGMIILSIAIVGLLLAFTYATKGTAASTNRTQATYLAQQTLENLKAQEGNLSPIDTTVVSPVGKYTIVISTPTVSAINHLSDHLEPYEVTVSWSDQSGGPASKSIRMVGYCYVNHP